jgi:hypothetical protein
MPIKSSLISNNLPCDRCAGVFLDCDDRQRLITSIMMHTHPMSLRRSRAVCDGAHRNTWVVTEAGRKGTVTRQATGALATRTAFWPATSRAINTPPQRSAWSYPKSHIRGRCIHQLHLQRRHPPIMISSKGKRPPVHGTKSHWSLHVRVHSRVTSTPCGGYVGHLRNLSDTGWAPQPMWTLKEG